MEKQNAYLTIEGFEKLSKQQLFDKALAHIGQTRKKSTINGSCKYEGSGCAAAPFLKPEKRAEADNQCNIDSSSWFGLADIQVVPDHEVDFVGRLQECHDQAAYDPDAPSCFMADWVGAMRLLAQQSGLSTEKLDAIKL